MLCCKGKGLSWGQILLQPLARRAWLCRENPTTLQTLVAGAALSQDTLEQPQNCGRAGAAVWQCWWALQGQAGHPWLGTA